MSGLTEEQVFYLVRGQIVYLEPHQAHGLDDMIGMDDPDATLFIAKVSDDEFRFDENLAQASQSWWKVCEAVRYHQRGRIT